MAILFEEHLQMDLLNKELSGDVALLMEKDEQLYDEDTESYIVFKTGVDGHHGTNIPQIIAERYSVEFEPDDSYGWHDWLMYDFEPQANEFLDRTLKPISSKVVGYWGYNEYSGDYGVFLAYIPE